MRGQQSGFSALEIIIAIAIVGMMAVTLLGPFGSYMDQYQKEDSAQRTKQLGAAIREAYRRELMTVGDAGGATVRFGGVDIPNNSLATASLLSPVERYASVSAKVLAQDGYNQAQRIFVSNELTQVVSGTTLSYRVIAIVSIGHNGALDSTFDPATGSLTIGGDDTGEVINGYTYVREAYDDAARKLQSVATAYQNYFLTRYLANPSRSVGVDYFANTDASGTTTDTWDSTGTILSTGGAAVGVDTVNLPTALGLAINDVTTGSGAIIQVDNSSANVNQPDQPTATRALPPYSARLSAPLPGGNEIVATVTGIYN